MSNQIVSEVEVEDCPICMEAINYGRNMIVTECGHNFHYTCLTKHTGNGCPCCRSVLPSRQVVVPVEVTDLTAEELERVRQERVRQREQERVRENREREHQLFMTALAQERAAEDAIRIVDRFVVPDIVPFVAPRDRIRDIVAKIDRAGGQLMRYYELICGAVGEPIFKYNSSDEIADIISSVVETDAPAFRKQRAALAFKRCCKSYVNQSRKSAGIKAERASKMAVKSREMVLRASERVSEAATRTLAATSTREFNQASAVFDRAVAKFASYHESGLANVINAEQELTSYQTAKNEFVDVMSVFTY